MIVVNIGEGLGNQMFEYSFLLKLKSLYPNQKFKIDPNYTFKYIHNGYELERIFGIKEEICTYKEFVELTDLVANNINEYSRFFLKRKRDLRKLLFGQKATFYQQEDPTQFYPYFLDVKTENAFFQGIFANYRYFHDIKKDIIKTFSFPEINDKKNKNFKKLITKSESVGIHIRRGDYIQNGIKCLDYAYYNKAIEIIEKKINHPCCLFVFSDDIPIAKTMLGNRTNIFFVDCNDASDSYKDMQLMSLCKHNIIANSSFSFWGAYLNNSPNKMVISSSIPYNNLECPFSCDDWISI